MHAFLLVLLCTALLAAQPQSTYVTDAMKKAESLGISTSAAQGFTLHAEKTDFRETGTYDEALQFCRTLAQRYPTKARYQEFGKSALGRPLVTLTLSTSGFTPAAMKASRKPIVLLQNGIHAGEIGGKDASLMLARDLLSHPAWQGLLKTAIVVIIPVFNVDGHENRSPYHRINQNGPANTGFRGTANNLNLNRDYTRGDAVEMQAWLKLYTSLRPHLLIDNHVTDGQDLQYDVTVDIPNSRTAAPEIAEWVNHWYKPYLEQELRGEGHIVGPYVPQDMFGPRYSQGYAALRNRASLLVETHSLKPYKVQVWAHYDIMLKTLTAMAEFGDDLVKAAEQADTNAAQLAGKTVDVDWKLGGTPFEHKVLGVKAEQVKSAVSGGTYAVYKGEGVEIPLRWYPEYEPLKQVTAPAKYLISQVYPWIAERLQWHGVKVTKLAKDTAFQVEQYRLSSPRFAPQTFEGRTLVDFDIATEAMEVTARSGDFVAEVKDVDARIAMVLLEPQSRDSYVRWGMLNAIFERKEYFSNYVFEPIAAQMLEQDAKLKAEFEAKVAADKAFAANPRERLNWLYERSPYAEKSRGVYPVWRVMN